jgi:hypothetical protein
MTDFANLGDDAAIRALIYSAHNGTAFVIEDGRLKRSSAHSIAQPTPLPRGEGADAPQSPHGDGKMPLEYTEQNFNMLVAANTAMQSEIAGKDAIIADVRERLDDMRRELKNAERAYSTIVSELGEAKSQRQAGDEERMYERRRADALARRLDRALGYIDRVNDSDQIVTDEEGKPNFPSTIGPDVEAIDMPFPRGAASLTSSAFAAAEPATIARSEYPARRY